MAKTAQSFIEQASALKSALIELEDWWLLKARKIVIKHNAVGYSDAGDTPKPAYINENVNGDIDTLDFTRQNYMSGITVLQQLENFFTNLAVAQGAYKDTVSLITDSK